MNWILTAKVLVTVVALAQSLGPMKADFNSTHATNPEWTPHARFHVVWQVLQQSAVSLAVLYLLWVDPSASNTLLAALLAFSWTVTFFLTFASMRRFGGSLLDSKTGIQPFSFRFGQRTIEVDTNLFGATMLGTLCVVALALLAIGTPS